MDQRANDNTIIETTPIFLQEEQHIRKMVGRRAWDDPNKKAGDAQPYDIRKFNPALGYEEYIDEIQKALEVPLNRWSTVDRYIRRWQLRIRATVDVERSGSLVPNKLGPGRDIVAVGVILAVSRPSMKFEKDRDLGADFCKEIFYQREWVIPPSRPGTITWGASECDERTWKQFWDKGMQGHQALLYINKELERLKGIATFGAVTRSLCAFFIALDSVATNYRRPEIRPFPLIKAIDWVSDCPDTDLSYLSQFLTAAQPSWCNGEHTFRYAFPGGSAIYAQYYSKRNEWYNPKERANGVCYRRKVDKLISGDTPYSDVRTRASRAARTEADLPHGPVTDARRVYIQLRFIESARCLSQEEEFDELNHA